MLSFLKRQKYDVAPLFEAALKASRNPVLYAQYGVPDTFDGRFDSLLLHMWPVFRALEGQDRLSQDLYDFTFKRMELALRETGTGDLGVGKNVRLMMKAFYGRLVTYNGCTSHDEWRQALARNLYGTAPDAQVPDAMVAYAHQLGQMSLSLDDLRAGRVIFPAS